MNTLKIIKNTQIPLLELSEVAIIPSVQTKIHSRTNECNARTPDKKLPIFIAPMNCVVNEKNFDIFNKDFYAIYPRTIDFDERVKLLLTGQWVAFGLHETERLISDYIFPSSNSTPIRICIDQANGHMEDVIIIGKKLRTKLDYEAPGSEIMIGNIANPDIIPTLVYANFADWVRLGIGGGSVCTTSAQTGVHYPMASLIVESCYYRSTTDFGNNKRYLRLIADGGIGDSEDICKALALGADAVMCGRLFCMCEESASPFLYEVNPSTFDTVETRYKEYWGMSTKKAQKQMGGLGNKNSEGIIDTVMVDCNLDERTKQVESAIKSAMSYCNAYTLEEFRENSQLSRITPTAAAAYKKHIQIFS